MPEDLWAAITPKVEESLANFGSFRSAEGINSRLAHWNPREATFRWFKSYLHLAAKTAPEHELKVLDGTNPRDLGGPLTVVTRCGSDGALRSVDLDYLLAAEEVGFLLRQEFGRPIRAVCEIGAGFGRTAHTIIKNLPEIETYQVVDLPETLALSRRYLQRVLHPIEFEKVTFLSTEEGLPRNPEWDLAIQIDGLQEMARNDISLYLESLFIHARFVYLCNPVGKYEPDVAGILDPSPIELRAAMTSGLSLQVINPWDDDSIHEAIPAHVLSYCPNNFSPTVTESSRLRPFYLHALYERI